MREFLAIFLRAGRAPGGGRRRRRRPPARPWPRASSTSSSPTCACPTAAGWTCWPNPSSLHPDTQVIVVTAFATAETAIAAMKAGAYDYLTKPFKVDEVGLVVERALERRVLQQPERRPARRDQGPLQARPPDRQVAGHAPGVRDDAQDRPRPHQRAADRRVGHRQGAGRPRPARAVAAAADHAFIAVNCGAIPEIAASSPSSSATCKGAFTGANTDRTGLFEAAHGGHHLPRRDRRAAGPHAGEAAARAAGAQGEAGGRRAGEGGRRAGGGRHQPRPRDRGGEGDLPPGPVLPAQRHPAAPAAAARAARGHPPPGRPLRAQVRRRARPHRSPASTPTPCRR